MSSSGLPSGAVYASFPTSPSCLTQCGFLSHTSCAKSYDSAGAVASRNKVGIPTKFLQAHLSTFWHVTRHSDFFCRQKLLSVNVRNTKIVCFPPSITVLQADTAKSVNKAAETGGFVYFAVAETLGASCYCASGAERSRSCNVSPMIETLHRILSSCHINWRSRMYQDIPFWDVA